MPKQVTLTIDGRELTVPEGMLLVDAAKTIGIDIPVFCYHPKMEPVGMCRMCLVDIGRPSLDRATGEFVKDETGKPKIAYGPKLETACTTPVSEGMLVIGMSEKVELGRREIIEFLLTSHPLDCPICDKGGECPLQNLTMAYGPATSRFLYEEKMHLAKHYPLGDLIVLDRERCIQCARCIRFQCEIADDPVIEFYQRGRALEIVSFSEPAFDSYFSGNTTDICPVGALTNADFRFRARPWEMNSAASICPHCPVGCNLTLNVRREARSGGDTVIKRVMPRQNEAVNEIWICDKGRYGYHYTMDPERLSQPLVRNAAGELAPAAWDEAMLKIADQMKYAGPKLVTLAGGRLSNEDLYNLWELTQARGGQALLHTVMGGGDLTTRFGLTPGSNLKDLGPGDAILVVACDLEEEAPLWWLRIRQAAQRGATLIVVNPRETKLDRAAKHQIRYAYGEEAAILSALIPGAAEKGPAAEVFSAAAQAFADAGNAIVIYGSEGTDLVTSQAIAEGAARLLQTTGHTGRPNNGLLAAWTNGNTQGAYEIGFRPVADLASALAPAGLVYIAAADPVGDDPALAAALSQTASFVVVQDLFLTETARVADVVLPALPFTNREGSFTNGERRAQRFYLGVPPRSQARPDFTITAQIGMRLGIDLEGRSALLAFNRLAAAVPSFNGQTYERLAEVAEQWPIFGRHDLYYAGTGYENLQGLGQTLRPAAALASIPETQPSRLPVASPGEESLLALPVTRLYDRAVTLWPSELLRNRLTPPSVCLSQAEADRLGLASGEEIQVSLNGVTCPAVVLVQEGLPDGIALVPRSVGLPITAPSRLSLTKLAALEEKI